MNNVSAIIARWLAQEGIIPDEDQNLYSYAAYCFFFGLLPIIISITFGLLFGMFTESLLLILPFMLLRKFSGGFHLNSSVACIISSATLIALTLGCIKFISPSSPSRFFTVLVTLATFSLFMNSPIEADSKPLSNKERKLFRLIARVLSVCMLVVYFLVTANQQIAIPFGFGILITALLQIPCLFKRHADR